MAEPVYTAPDRGWDGHEVRVLSIDRHRNGVGGMGFVVALVEWDDPDVADCNPFLTISFPHPGGSKATPDERREYMRGHTAQVSIPLALDPEVGIYFARGNSWRGADYIGPVIVEAYHKSMLAEGGPLWCPYGCCEESEVNEDEPPQDDWDGTLHCDYCDEVEYADDLTPDWNGETGNHLSCEKIIADCEKKWTNAK